MNQSIQDLTPFEQAIHHNWPEEFTLIAGLYPSCPECQENHKMTPRQFFTAYVDGKIADEPHFSWRACHCCGSNLGGDRYAGHADHEEHGVDHLEICTDCLLYIAIGKLPEHWEG